MSDAKNPFPGPQPYRAADRRTFFGRDALVAKLTHQILARPSTTLYGPSGAGKSSLMQAGVIPRLLESHDFRVVRVDGWPPGESPLRWLMRAIFTDLELGAAPVNRAAIEALDEAMALAERRSEQPILIYLDQLEQLLFPERAEAESDALLDGIERLARAPIQGLQMVLSLREDYLGRFRDRARDRGGLLAHGFRLGPLTVGEMVKAVRRAAAAGEPPQRWDEQQLRGLMLEVRTPGQRARDEAEVQAAYAQIVCRALFQERAQGRAEQEIEAEPILRRYFEATLEDLGDLAPDARRLLEDHLVTSDGSRTLRTENELLRILPAARLAPILKVLEGAAILHAEAHQGSRYFEIGHDWLARRVHEARQRRELEEEQRRREAEQEEALRRQRAEAEARLAEARRQRRLFAGIALAALVVAAGAVIGILYALRLRSNAIAERERARAAERDARQKAIDASDARLLAGFRELKNAGQLPWAIQLLAEVQQPEAARGWVALASDALGANALERTLRGHDKALRAAAWSPDGARVVTASADRSARVWSADGRGDPLVIGGPDGHQGALTTVAWSPDGARVLTASDDGTARVWRADGGGYPLVLKAGKGALVSAAWSPDGQRIVTASRDGVARVWRADSTRMIELTGHTAPLTIAVFHPDGERVLTASEDGTARVWRADGAGSPVIFQDHRAAVLHLAVSPDGARAVTTSRDRTARVWELSGKRKGKAVVLGGHEGEVTHAAWSPDGARVATASADRTARVWATDGKGEPVILRGHDLAVTFVAFRNDGRYLSTASLDQTARIWPAEGGTPLVLRGDEAPVVTAAWSPDGARLLTASGQGERPTESAARIWRPRRLEALPRRRAQFFHSASLGAGGEVVVSAYDDKAARLWRVDGAVAPVVFKGHADWVASAALSPDGERVATASFDGTARVYRADGTGEPVVLGGHGAAVRAAVFSPDGSRVVTISDDRTARVRRADGQGEAVVLSGHQDSLSAAAWSPDGARVVTASLDHTARVWRAGGPGAAVALVAHGGGVHSAAWSPDGARIVTASEDGTAQVWNAETGALMKALEHGSPVLRAIWSPDGARIATSSLKGGLRLWSADGAGEPVVLEVAEPLIAMAFVEGGAKIVGVAADNTTRAWTIEGGALKRGLAEVNADCLPAKMRAIYLGETAEKAGEGYAACERGYGRTPYSGEGPP